MRAPNVDRSFLIRCEQNNTSRITPSRRYSSVISKMDKKLEILRPADTNVYAKQTPSGSGSTFEIRHSDVLVKDKQRSRDTYKLSNNVRAYGVRTRFTRYLTFSRCVRETNRFQTKRPQTRRYCSKSNKPTRKVTDVYLNYLLVRTPPPTFSSRANTTACRGSYFFPPAFGFPTRPGDKSLTQFDRRQY